MEIPNRKSKILLRPFRVLFFIELKVEIVMKKEIMELGHEPKPGYDKIYYAAIGIGIIYLAIVFLMG